MAPMKCNGCGTAAKDQRLSVCSGCRLVHYCSKRCQKESWPTHRVACKAAKKDAEAHFDEMWHAAQKGNPSQLRRILNKYPATVNMNNTRNMGGIMMTHMSALEIATAEGHLECVKMLLACGADQLRPEPDFGLLPIHRAAEKGHLDIVKYLLEKGAQILQPDGMGQTVLHFAAEHGQTEVCKFLLDHGAKPSLKVKYKGMTPEMWAEMGGHYECAAIL